MSAAELESVEAFRERARRWITSNLSPKTEHLDHDLTEQRALSAALQAKIFEAGFAGLAVPAAYGGAGLTLDHQRVWAEETKGHDLPSVYVVSLGMILPTLLDCASEAVKTRHIPRMLRGEEVWIQLLSEPSGGSDLAGAVTRATRREDAYVINGSKMWSSNADWAEYGICLARVDWDAPKHQGLAMFALPLKAKGVTISPIIPATGAPAHFFIEYFDDVEISTEYCLGGAADGWSVAQRLLFHERNATAGVGFAYGLGGGAGDGRSAYRMDIIDLARRHGSACEPSLAATIADDHIDLVVSTQLASRINTGMKTDKLQGQWGSLLKLGLGIDTPVNAEAALAVSGADGVIWIGDGPGGEVGLNWLKVRGLSIAGGSNEIQRNIVSERLLNLPREAGDDKSLSFSALVNKRRLSRI